MSTPNPAYVRAIQFLIEHKACSGFLSCWSAADPAIKAVIAEVWGGDPWPQASEPTRSTTTTTDPTDPRLGHGVDEERVEQNAAYLVLSEAERRAGFVRPLRRSYVHDACGVVTTMSQAIAETYARNPRFYGSTFCVGCRMHRDVAEFVWDGTTERVGS